MSENRVVSFDASCSCGQQQFGAYSAEEAEHWALHHQCADCEGEEA